MYGGDCPECGEHYTEAHMQGDLLLWRGCVKCGGKVWMQRVEPGTASPDPVSTPPAGPRPSHHPNLTHLINGLFNRCVLCGMAEEEIRESGKGCTGAYAQIQRLTGARPHILVCDDLVEPATGTASTPTPVTIPYPGPNYIDISKVKVEWHQVTRLDGTINMVGAYKLICTMLNVHFVDECEFSLRDVDGKFPLRNPKGVRSLLQLVFRMCAHEEIVHADK